MESVVGKVKRRENKKRLLLQSGDPIDLRSDLNGQTQKSLSLAFRVASCRLSIRVRGLCTPTKGRRKLLIWLRDQTKGQYVFGKREGIDSIEVREIPGKGGSRVYVQYLLAGVNF